MISVYLLLDNFGLLRFNLQPQPAPLLTGADFQQHISGLGNVWETFRACTAHSASMCQSINFYSLLFVLSIF